MKTFTVYDNDGRSERTRAYMIDSLVTADENDNIMDTRAKYDAMLDAELCSVYTANFSTGH